MEFKRCRTCGVERPLSDFAKHRNGLQSKCKLCNRNYQRAHYAAHRADYIAKAAVWLDLRRAENVRRVLAYLKGHPCVDCGESDPVVLQFDHVRGSKRREVGNMISSGTRWELIAAEIEKCDIRCANCHWRRHARERGWRKLALAVSGVAW